MFTIIFWNICIWIFEIACLIKNKCYKIILQIWYMCVSRDRERDSLVNIKYLVLYICTTILIEKMIPFHRSNLFSYIWYTHSWQLRRYKYIYIGVNQLYINVLKIYSLPTHLFYMNKVHVIVYIPFKELESAINHVDAWLQWWLCLFKKNSVWSFFIAQFV